MSSTTKEPVSSSSVSPANYVNPLSDFDLKSVFSIGRSGFNAVGKVKAGPQASVDYGGIKRRIIRYCLPGDASPEHRLLAMQYLVCCGAYEGGTTDEWASWLYTWVGLAYPKMVPKPEVLTKEYMEIPFPDKLIEQLTEASEIIRTDQSHVIDPMELKGFPEVGYPYDHAIWSSGTMEHLYGYFSLTLYLMGKIINDSNRSQMHSRRPKAIKDKYKMRTVEPILDGEAKMSNECHKGCNVAWTIMTPLKRVIVPAFAQFNQVGTGDAELVYVTFRLNEYSFMQSAHMIDNLVRSCPWVMNIPQLRTQVDFYIDSLKEWNKVPEIEQPYIKVIEGDGTRLFHSRTLKELAACALLWMSQTNPTILSYSLQANTQVVNLFIAAAKDNGTPLAEGILQKTQISDVTV